MPKQFNMCEICGHLIKNDKDVYTTTYPDKPKIKRCVTCFKNNIETPIDKPMFKKVEFNEPNHYHTHDIDTIEFLKRGFPPQVLTGFLIGNIIKYTQRFEYKNGEEDVLKIVDYAKRLEEWYKETHS